MNVEQAFERPSPERSEVQLLRSEHGNIARLLLVLESHLALMIMDERFDGSVMLDAIDYLIDYVGDFHRVREDRVVSDLAVEQPAVRSCEAMLTAQHDALRTSGPELSHRLDLALRDESIDRGEIVRLGYAYCTDLRRCMSIEEATLSGANWTADQPAIARPDSDGEAGYRARFEELTSRVGCDCAYGEK